MLNSLNQPITRDSNNTHSKPILSARHLIPGVLLFILTAVVSGLLLSWHAERLLIIHLISGTSSFVPLAFFLAGHWWKRRKTVGRHPNARFGYVALVCLLLLLISGLALLPWTNVKLFGYIHTGAALVLLLDLSLHMAWRTRLRLKSQPRKLVQGWPLLLGPVALSMALFVLIAPQKSTYESPASLLVIAHDNLEPGGVPSAAECQACHSDIAERWAVSAHAGAAVDDYYLALSSMFIQEKGVEAVRFCAGCHNPVGLMQGEIDPLAEVTGSVSNHAYEARSLGVNLALSQRAAEGVTCIACHQASAGDSVQKSTRAIRLEEQLPKGILPELALKVAPEYHRGLMSLANPVSAKQESAVCQSCHNLTLPSGFRLEPTFDEWLDSPYPEQGVSCQDCHMAEVGGQRVDSGQKTKIAAHGGMPGAPSSLPNMASGTKLLSQAANLDIEWNRGVDGQFQLTVWVANTGAGHYFPTGADDLRQLWLSVTVRNAAGEEVWQSGQPAADGRLPSDTVQFRKVLGDASGRPIELHRIWVATQVLSDTRLAPLEIRPVIYIPGLPEPGDYMIEARLLYRDVSPDFAEFALDRAVTDLPIFEAASIERRISSSEISPQESSISKTLSGSQ